MAIAFEATGTARDILAGIARTEDVKFSPDGRMLAIVDYDNEEVAVFELALAEDGVRLTRGVRLASDTLIEPHGIDFIGNERVVVASRRGVVALFDVPERDGDVHKVEPAAVLGDDPGARTTPGSVAVHQIEPNRFELLTCHNYENRVGRSEIDLSSGTVMGPDATLLERWLDIPDGVCISPDGAWIAMSNHRVNAVMLYRRDESLGPESDPDGIARGVAYPHGLVFSTDSRSLIVADAGSPHVHTFRAGPSGWSGVHHPASSHRVLSETVFQRGRRNPTEGGPKGLDLHPIEPLVAVTCEEQTLAFIPLADLTVVDASANDELHLAQELDRCGELIRMRQTAERERERAHEEAMHAQQVLGTLREWDAHIHEVTELLSATRADLQQARKNQATQSQRITALERQLEQVYRSRSWRMTRPLRSASRRWADRQRAQ